MGSVVTFYSYKGGVGRSMVLANIAVLLSQAGQRVLVVDWDLEAPGIERYFHYFTRSPAAEGGGLLPMLVDAMTAKARPYAEYLETVDVGTGKSFALLASGREAEPARYARWLEQFDWRRFFSKGGGDFLEDLRKAWKRDFDVVLIDSRTGLSDTGGVCTIQMPDVVVVMFTANYQSMLGARDVMRLVRQARQSLAYPRMQLTVLPLPARFGTRSSSAVADEWLDRFADAFAEFYDDWLPSRSSPKEALDRVKIPQTDEFGFGEQLAVVEQGVDEPASVGHACNQVARLLQDDFRAAHDVLTLRERTPDRTPVEPTDGYEWDLFVSHQGSASMTLVTPLIEALRQELARYGITRVFIDSQEVRVGEAFAFQVTDTLRRAKILLAVLTPGYFRSPWATAELQSFLERERRTNVQLIVPVQIRGRFDELPRAISERQLVDMTSYTTVSKSHQRIPGLARTIVARISDAPPYEPDFPIIAPDQVDLHRPNRFPPF